MNFSVLLEEALEERGNAVLVIARPADAENAIIQNSNRLFARLMGKTEHTLIGRSIGSLRGAVADPQAWASFIAALRGLVPAELDMRLQGASPGQYAWLGFGLTFKTDSQAGSSYGVLIGRDITQARRKAAKDAESQRLLAAMFLRTSAALLVVRPDGGVLMTNPAFQRLLGYTAEEVLTLNAEDLTTGEFAEIARAARAKQLRDGGNYEIRIETVSKTGIGVPVRLSSVLVHDSASGSLRVVTLIPDFTVPALAAAPPAASKVMSRSIGQLRAISLAAFKTAFAEAWPRVASRAMLMAEQIIRRRLGATDVLNRSDDHGFVIWFDSTDEDANNELLARAAREIKLRFLSEFGEEVAACVSAVVVGDGGNASPPGTMPLQTLLDRFQSKRDEATMAAKCHIAKLGEDGSGVLQPITDRNGKLKAVVLADFTLELRRQAASMAATLSPSDATGIDLHRLDLAASALPRHRGGILVPIAWRTLADPVSRRLFDERVARIAAASLSNLQLALCDVPPFPNSSRWSEVVAPIRRMFGEVAIMITLEQGETATVPEAVAAEWPLSLLVVDATAAGSMAADGYFGVIAAARNRDIAVMARVAAASDARDWHELGATMFAIG